MMFYGWCRKRMQVGVVVGFLLDLLFGVWRYLLDSTCLVLYCPIINTSITRLR